jgi:hypothetical protein
MTAAANNSMAAAITAGATRRRPITITGGSRGDGRGSVPAAHLRRRRTNMPTETNHQEFETIDSAELASATGGTAKDTVAKIGQDVQKALPAVENAAMTIAGLVDG